MFSALTYLCAFNDLFHVEIFLKSNFKLLSL